MNKNEESKRTKDFNSLVKGMNGEELHWAAVMVAAGLIEKRNEAAKEIRRLKKELEAKNAPEQEIYQVKVLFYYKKNVVGKTADILFARAGSKTEAEQIAVQHLEEAGHDVLSVTSIRQIEVIKSAKTEQKKTSQEAG